MFQVKGYYLVQMGGGNQGRNHCSGSKQIKQYIKPYKKEREREREVIDERLRIKDIG